MSGKSELLQPYRGTKDFYPPEFRRLDYIFSVWREACKAYGYEEYLGPTVEHRELYTQKKASGEEIANQQLYWFTDQGGREIAIRPEMTPTVSRMVGARIESLPKPVRWFSIACFMRYERPQKGRLREFFQLNVDNFGVALIELDAELVELAIFTMGMFGATSEMFEIRLNNRKWFDYYLSGVLGLDENKQAVSRIVDNFAKLSREDNLKKLAEIGIDKGQAESLLQLSSQTIEEVKKHMTKSEGARSLVELFEILTARGFGEYLVYDGAMIRGFDYYTDNVFEQYDKHPDNNRSMFGGGRYDELVELYSGKHVPASGYAPGNVTTELFLDNWNLWPELGCEIDVFVSVFNDDVRLKSWEIAAMLRDSGLNVELYHNASDKMANQLAYANKKGIPMAVILGPEEAEREVFVMKNMISGKQEEIKVADLLASLDEANDDEHNHE